MISTVSITDLKQNTATVIEQVKDSEQPTYILQHSEVAAVLVSTKFIEQYEKMLEAIEDMDDLLTYRQRKDEETMPLQDVIKEHFGP